MRACVRVRSRALLLRACEFARSDGGGGDGEEEEERGGKNERLQCWDHVIAVAIKSLGILD